ncbi:MAG: WYL domain-containing protein [Acidimicrobiia bacterium]|nr:WYL domain-containing protein [Acidimicrobiia bacterium]
MRHGVEGRLRRVLAMLVWLDGRDPVSVPALCRRFGVTRRQLEVDLAAAATMAPGDAPGGAPLLEIDTEADTVELVFLPGVFRIRGRLSREEAFATLAVGNAARELLGADTEALTSALEKLEAALEVGRHLAVDIDHPEHLGTIRAAIAEHRTLEIDYWSAWREERTVRRIDPLHVFFTEGEWYVTGADHRAGGHRRFRLDRLVDCRPTGDHFEPVDVQEDLRSFTTPQVPFEEVKVRFGASAAWVPEYVAGEVVEEDDDGFVMRLTTVGELWLSRLLLRTGGQVLEPASLVELHRRAAQRTLALYTSTQ